MHNNIKIVKATLSNQLEAIAALANEIIPQHYGSFLPMQHIRFFIDTYQSVPAMEEQLLQGVVYYLIKDSDNNIAYLGIEHKDTTLILSKIYVLNEYRGRGIGRFLMQFLYQRAAALKVTKIELYVVTENSRAVHFYLKEGFIISETIDKAYKSGTTVKEYRLTKRVGQATNH